MKQNLMYLILFVLLGMSTNTTLGNDLRFKQLTIEDGLSQSRVFDIIQDSKGFIWIATEDGLNRYDGYEFKVFNFDPNDSSSIGGNTIQALAADDSGNVWIGTSFSGLNKYNAKTGKFTIYRHDPDDSTSISSNIIFDIHKDKKGNLWLATTGTGFDYFDVKSEKFFNHQHDPDNSNSVISNEPNFIFEDSRGTVWIGSNIGLDRYYPATNTFRHYIYREGKKTGMYESPLRRSFYSTTPKNSQEYGSIGNKDGINSPFITVVFEDRQGYLWFGSIGGGLNRFDPQTESFTHILLDPDHPESPSNNISAIREDRKGILWVGTWGGGLYQIETHSKKRKRYVNRKGDITSISYDFISTIYEDATGEIWIGTDLLGVSKIDRSASKFKTISSIAGEPNSLSANAVRSFWKDDNGILWLGTSGGGLDRYDQRNGIFKNYRSGPGQNNQLKSNIIRALYQDNSGIMWLGTIRGLVRFDPVKETFKHIFVNPDNPDDPANLVNYKIMELENMPGFLWFGTNGGGVCRYEIKTGELKQYLHDTTNMIEVQLNFVRTLHQYRKDPNILWVGAFGGFSRFNIEEESFKSYVNDPNNPRSLSSNNIMSFTEDQKGNLWITTYGGGINYFNPQTEEFQILTVENSDLPSNSVYGFLPDNNGYLWLSSNRGLSKFDPVKKTFKNYTVEDGLQSDEFNGGAFYQSKAGEMFFGGINGFNSFYPESITDNPYKPHIELTDFKLFNQSIDINNEGPLQAHISETDQITLEHWQNDIEIEYVGLHYYRSTNNSYTYILDNYDKDWRFVGTTRSAVYTNLDPGEYSFRVKAANSDGIWNEDGPVLSIIILPPWYSTTWAYVGYGIIFLLAVFAFDRIQRFRLTQRERNRSMIREAELRAKVAEEENERKSHELEEARRLQLALLPEKLPELPNLEIAVYMKTATEVGGDYYDFNISADGTLNIAIGDATGHGMRAGTVVTLMKGLFSADSGRMEIEDFFRQSSETIKDLRFGRMMMSFTLLKIKESQMLYSSAGMPPAYIYRSSTLKVEELSLEGMPLGAMKDYKYKVKKDTLNTGDTLLLMSDGLPELKNPDGGIFDYPRVEGVFRDVAGEAPQAIVDRLVDAGEIWRKGQPADDDVTLMVIRAR